jgi:hypothetical protein
MTLTNPRIMLEIEQLFSEKTDEIKKLVLSTAKLMEQLIVIGIKVELKNALERSAEVPLSIFELEEFILTKGNKDYSIFDPLEGIAPGMISQIFPSKKNDTVQLKLQNDQVIITIVEGKQQETIQISFEDFENCILAIIQFKKRYGEWHHHEPGTGDPVDDIITGAIESKFQIKYAKKKAKPTDSSGAGKFNPEE